MVTAGSGMTSLIAASFLAAAAAAIGSAVIAYTPARSPEHTRQIARRQIVIFLKDDCTAISITSRTF
jgi:hypothetical protein